MELKPYATAFHKAVIKHFNARLTMIESDHVIAFQLEYLDSLDIPSIELVEQDTESLLQRINLDNLSDHLVIKGIETRNLLIIKFPWIYGIKPKDPLYWSADNGKQDAKYFLQKTGRN